MMDSRLVATFDGSRMVEPKRRRRSPSDHRRQINHLMGMIVRRARERQEAWAMGGRPDITKVAETDLGKMYDHLRRTRREVYRTGEPEGTAYRGRTARVGRDA